MKKRNRYITLIFSFTLVAMLLCFASNFKTTYYQGVNYRVKSVKIPLYIKIFEFLSRDHHYKELVRNILDNSENDYEKVFKLFEWTHQNVRQVPEGFPIVDDHVWNIIIRGYGTDDQACDVFTTLCNYVGVKAFFSFLLTPDRKKMIALSFVKIDDKWYVFDPYNGVYFKDNKGNLADIETIKSGVYSLEGKKDGIIIDYSSYIHNLPSVKNIGFTKANIQSPLRRFIYEAKRKLGIK